MYCVMGPYKNFYGPYQLVDMMFFWQMKYPEDALSNRWDYKLNDRFGDWLAKTWVNTVCEKIQKWRGNRKIKVRIDPYDAWNIDSTLAPIILPLLKKLKESKHGSGFVDMNDVPEHMRTDNTEEYDDQSTFEFYRVDNEDELKYNIHDRWDWVLDEMIWTFEQLQPDADWEEQYWIEHPKMDLATYPEDEGQTCVPVRWSVEGKCDWDGRQKHQERISNGLRLFGTYYQNLWD